MNHLYKYLIEKLKTSSYQKELRKNHKLIHVRATSLGYDNLFFQLDRRALFLISFAHHNLRLIDLHLSIPKKTSATMGEYSGAFHD